MLGEGAVTRCSLSSPDLALGLEKKRAHICEPGELFLFDPVYCSKQTRELGRVRLQRIRLSGASFIHLNHLCLFLIHSLLPLTHLNSCVTLVGSCVCPLIQAPIPLGLVVVVKDLNSWSNWLKLDIEMIRSRNKLLFSNDTPS